MSLPHLTERLLKGNLSQRLTDWQGLLGREPIAARQALKKLLAGRLIFAPQQDGRIRFKAKGRLDRLLEGLLPASIYGGGVPDGIRYLLPSLPIRGEVYRRAA